MSHEESIEPRMDSRSPESKDTKMVEEMAEEMIEDSSGKLDKSEDIPEDIPKDKLENNLDHNPQQNTEDVDEKPEPPQASALEGGREVSNKILYVGSLHRLVTEEELHELFSQFGGIKLIKVLNDKNKPGFNYAFIEFDDHSCAASALTNLNGNPINNVNIKINWAYHSSNANSVQSTQPVFNVFVGDLASDINDETLNRAFSTFSSLKEAHVMWDMQTSRSRGYGFVTFFDQQDAETALKSMNGQMINGRPVRCNWASHKQMNSATKSRKSNGSQGGIHGGQSRSKNNQYKPYNYGQIPQQNYLLSNQRRNHPKSIVDNNIPMIPDGVGGVGGVGGVDVSGSVSPDSQYDIVVRLTPAWQTTIYIGNIANFSQRNDFVSLLQGFGYLVDVKFHPEKGCAFVKFDTHEIAAMTIVRLAGYNFNGRPLKCGWGKEKPPMFNHRSMYQG